MVVLSSSKRLASWLYPYLDANLLTLLAVTARQQVVVSKWKIKDLSDRLVGQTFKKISKQIATTTWGRSFSKADF